jgi:hypothetical protein
MAVNIEIGIQEVQYVSDADGNTVGVIVPIDLWREIESERETAYLLKSDAMKQRLLEAKGREGGFTLEEVREKLGI